MLAGTLAIAGIPPLSGFFSKDEILLRAFLSYKVVWVIAVATALMTAFYMFRLLSMTFLGAYRGKAWEAGHGEHEASHGSPPHAAPAHDTSGHAHSGAHAWHGPHESPRPMTVPLMALAVGAVLAGFVGVPAALGGSDQIGHFLRPSFTASQAGTPAAATEGAEPAGDHEPAEEPARSTELSLMAFSVLIAVAGILLARRFYVTNPEISERLGTRLAGPHRVLSNKYYVDELYDATVVSATFSSGRGLWAFDRGVIDGMVNGGGWITLIGAWLSGLTDRSIVDGMVNLVGRVCEAGSFWFRKVQTGLVQNYALLMLFGVFALSVYLFISL